jgi:hypothetical protein
MMNVALRQEEVCSCAFLSLAMVSLRNPWAARAQTGARLCGGDRAAHLLDSLPRTAALQALQAHSTHRSPYLNGIGR